MELLALNCIVEMYYQQRCRCQPIEIERQWGWESCLSCAALCARCIFAESHSLALECKVGGKFHVKVNMQLRLIAHKYHEGNMKRTLKRELNEFVFAEHKVNRLDLLGGSVALAWQELWAVGVMILSLHASFYVYIWLPLHMNDKSPVGGGLHVHVMICVLINVSGVCVCSCAWGCFLPWTYKPWHTHAGKMIMLDPSWNTDQGV